MQKISVDTLCDNTTKHGEDEVPAETLPPVTVGRDKPRLLDLCADCRLELYEPFALLLDKEGRAEDTGRRKNKPRTEPPGDIHCKHCDHEPFKNERGLIVHMSTKHRDAEDPADSDEAPDDACPDCGRSGFKNLGAHRAKAHGYRVGDDDV